MKTLRVLSSLRRRLLPGRLRTVLSLASIAIGIAAAITVTSVGIGARNSMLAQVETMGKNLITIDAGKVREVIGRKRQTTKVTTLKERDCDAILRNSRFPVIASPTQDMPFLVKYANGTTSCRVIGTTPAYPAIRNYRVASGRFFSDEDITLSARVAVVGTKVREILFAGANPLGETIRINKVPFEIVGVLAPKGSSYDGANEDEVVLIPLRTGMRRLFNVDYIKNIYVSVQDKENMGDVEQDIRTLLRESHRLHLRDKEDDFTLQNSYTALAIESSAGKSFTFMIFGVAGLSLLVGGVGILAVMLLSVRERRPEIGLRLAVGAKKKDILAQFLYEAMMLSSVGGVLGIALGIAVTFSLDHMTELQPVISMASIAVAVTVSGLIGVAFGVYPARRASQVQPIQALRG
jgi:putative ABC transport system permease protein